MTMEQPWPWPATMDALLAASASHCLLLENDRVRGLDVVIEPRTREPKHTHQAPSVMIIDEPAQIRYYAGDALRFESQERFESPPGVRVRWMEPEDRIPSRTSMSTATTRSALNSSNAGAATDPPDTAPTSKPRRSRSPYCS